MWDLLKDNNGFLFMVQGKTSVTYEPVYSDENAR